MEGENKSNIFNYNRQNNLRNSSSILVLIKYARSQHECIANIPFAVDISNDLTDDEFDLQLDFIQDYFYQLLPKGLKPGYLIQYDNRSYVYHPKSACDIQKLLKRARQSQNEPRISKLDLL